MSPVNFGSQVDQVNPDPHDFHSRGLQVLRLLWVCLEDMRGRGEASCKSEGSGLRLVSNIAAVWVLSEAKNGTLKLCVILWWMSYSCGVLGWCLTNRLYWCGVQMVHDGPRSSRDPPLHHSLVSS